jgi:hypothetical protein
MLVCRRIDIQTGDYSMSKLALFTQGVRLTAVLGASSIAQVAHAVPDDLQKGVDGSRPKGSTGCLFVTQAGCEGQASIFQNVANILIFLVGAISVIMLIIGGLRYVLSSGEASAVKGAKDTILYAIIGIIVASLAFAAVNFVVGKLA